MLRTLAAAAALAAFIAPACAGEFTPNPLTSYLVDLDTPDQHMSAWRQDDISSLNALRATVKINNLVAPSGDMKPGFIFEFSNGEETAALYITGNWKNNHLAATLDHHLGKTDTKEGGLFLSSMLLETRKAFELAIDWNADGKLTATITGPKGPETLSVQLKAAPKQLEILSANGEIELNPIKLGRTSP